MLCGFFFKLNHALQPIHRCDTIEKPDSYSDKNYKLRLSILNMDQNSINVYDVGGDKVDRSDFKKLTMGTETM